MLHANLLLRDWTLSGVSFYATELPEYVLVVVFRGLGPADVHVSAAVTYTLLVLLAGVLAKGRATGRAALLRVLIATGIMVAPEIGASAYMLLLSPIIPGPASHSSSFGCSWDTARGAPMRRCLWA